MSKKKKKVEPKDDFGLFVLEPKPAPKIDIKHPLNHHNFRFQNTPTEDKLIEEFRLLMLNRETIINKRRKVS